MADSSEGLQSPGHRTRRTGATISVLFIRKKNTFPEASWKVPKASLARICHMDVPAIREGGDVNLFNFFWREGTKEPSCLSQTKLNTLFFFSQPLAGLFLCWQQPGSRWKNVEWRVNPCCVFHCSSSSLSSPPATGAAPNPGPSVTAVEPVLGFVLWFFCYPRNTIFAPVVTWAGISKYSFFPEMWMNLTSHLCVSRDSTGICLYFCLPL